MTSRTSPSFRSLQPDRRPRSAQSDLDLRTYRDPGDVGSEHVGQESVSLMASVVAHLLAEQTGGNSETEGGRREVVCRACRRLMAPVARACGGGRVRVPDPGSESRTPAGAQERHEHCSKAVRRPSHPARAGAPLPEPARARDVQARPRAPRRTPRSERARAIRRSPGHPGTASPRHAGWRRSHRRVKSSSRTGGRNRFCLRRLPETGGSCSSTLRPTATGSSRTAGVRRESPPHAPGPPRLPNRGIRLQEIRFPDRRLPAEVHLPDPHTNPSPRHRSTPRVVVSSRRRSRRADASRPHGCHESTRRRSADHLPDAIDSPAR